MLSNPNIADPCNSDFSIGRRKLEEIMRESVGVQFNICELVPWIESTFTPDEFANRIVLILESLRWHTQCVLNHVILQVHDLRWK